MFSIGLLLVFPFYSMRVARFPFPLSFFNTSSHWNLYLFLFFKKPFFLHIYTPSFLSFICEFLIKFASCVMGFWVFDLFCSVLILQRGIGTWFFLVSAKVLFLRNGCLRSWIFSIVEIGIDSFKIIVLLFVGIHSFSFSLPQFDRVFSISSSTFASFLAGRFF